MINKAHAEGFGSRQIDKTVLVNLQNWRDGFQILREYQFDMSQRCYLLFYVYCFLSIIITVIYFLPPCTITFVSKMRGARDPVSESVSVFYLLKDIHPINCLFSFSVKTRCISFAFLFQMHCIGLTYFLHMWLKFNHVLMCWWRVADALTKEEWIIVNVVQY